MAAILPTVSNMGLLKNQVLPKLWKLLRPPEPIIIPDGHAGVTDAAFQPDALPREDPRISRHNLHLSSEWDLKGH